MDPVSGVAGAVSSLANLAGTIIGGQQQAATQDYQRQALQRLLNQYTNIPLPQLQKLIPQLLGASAEGQVTADPRLAAAQLTQVQNLANEANQGGMTQADRASMLLASNQTAQNEQAQRSAIQNMLAARGLGGSGAAVGAMLAGQNQTLNSQANSAMQAQVAARQRALQAMQASGNLANQLSGQEFQQADTAAQARDMFSKYNAQALSNAQQYNNQIAQQGYSNQMGRQNAIAGATDSLVGNAGQTGAQQAAFSGGVGNAVGQMGAGIINAFGGGGGSRAAPASTTSYAAPPSSNFDNNGNANLNAFLAQGGYGGGYGS